MRTILLVMLVTLYLTGCATLRSIGVALGNFGNGYLAAGQGPYAAPQPQTCRETTVTLGGNEHTRRECW